MNSHMKDISKINLIWLRKNCKCEKCYNEGTNQTKQNDINLLAKINKFSIHNRHLEINWDDGHQSYYDLEWIQDHNRPEVKPEIVLWNGQEQELPQITTRDDKLDEHDIEKLIRAILQYGAVLVHNVSPTIEATENIAKHLGPIMNTFYGNMWEITEEIFDDYQDLSYKNGDLELHTDGTYHIETPGVLMFHSLKPAAKGGDTILADGFRIARELERTNKEYYDCLTRVPVEWQYYSKFYRFKHLSTLITTAQNSNQLQQIRYNSYHRGWRIPLTDDLDKFYTSENAFRDLLCDPKFEWRFSLQPGSMIFIDNWRLLHGRTAFIGERKLIGCYFSMNTLLNKARLLKLIL